MRLKSMSQKRVIHSSMLHAAETPTCDGTSN
jgi:hypothetical protein